MAFLALGINHKTASVDVRERVAFTPEQLVDALQQLCRLTASREAAILSTCNRTELYAASHVPNPLDAGAHFLADYHKLSYSELRPHLYMLPQHDAVALSETFWKEWPGRSAWERDLEARGEAVR